MHSPKRIKITDVNPHLICVLCGGYYIDATTIIECLHSFCKSCIVRYLQKNKYCPICDVQVHKTAPLLNIRSDKTLQNIVYKLVPSLFKNEMERRVAFYGKYPGVMPSLPEQRGEVMDTSPIFFPDELLMVCLEYQMDKTTDQTGNLWPKRYLHCPATVTVSHLVKLIRGKFGLSHLHHVSLFFKDDLLQEDITIMDIAYTYQCGRKMPIHLMFRILELKKKTIRLMPPVPPNKSDTLVQSEVLKKMEVEEQKIEHIDVLSEQASKAETVEEQNSRGVDLNKAKSTTDSVQTVNHVEADKSETKGKNALEVQVSNCPKLGDDPLPLNKIKEQGAQESADKEGIKINPVQEKMQKNEEESKVGEDCLEKVVKEKEKQAQPSTADATGTASEAELKEVQLQISENGVMSVRNMKSSECSPIPAVEAPCCPVSHPSTTSQANSTVTTSKVSFASVTQNRNTEPIVSVCKVSKDQVKKEVNHAVVSSENKLSISRVASPLATPLPTSPVSKGDVLNRIVSKLSPNETVIGNSGVTIRPVTKVYPGMKSLQERKNRTSSNNLQSRYKTVNQTTTWNPSLDKTTTLTLKQNCNLNKPPRFFKMRNTPRYLGNPAEGVKPIYGGGRQEDSSVKQSPPKSPVKPPPPYTPRGQDKPPPPYTPRPAHTGCGGAATYLPPNPYHLLYSGFPFSSASPELLRTMCASTAYHPSLPPSISMLYNNPGLQQTPQRSQPPPPPHDFKSTPPTPPSIQRIPSSLSPKPLHSLEDKKRDVSPASSSSCLSARCHKPFDEKHPPIPLPPPPIPLSDKSPSPLTNNNNTKESLHPTSINQHL